MYTVSIDNTIIKRNQSVEDLINDYPNAITAELFKAPYTKHVLVLRDKKVTIERELQ